MLVLSQNLDYVYLDSSKGDVISQGKFPENVGQDALPINGVYCYWFCDYDGEGKILFYSIERKGIYLFDLNFPSSKAQAWSSGQIEVNAEYMHNFIWLNYDQENDECLLLHNKNDQSIGCYVIKKDAVPEDKFTQDIRNANLLLKEGNMLFLACNTDARNFPIYMISRDGLKTFTFETKIDATIIEIGFLNENLMFFLYNEGETAAVGVFLIQLGNFDLKDNIKISDSDDCVQRVTLHNQDEESIMSDCYALVNRVMCSITLATVCDRLATYKFNLEADGKYKATEEMIDVSGVEMKSISTNFSLERDTLVSCQSDDDDSGKIRIATHSLTDLKCYYYWLLLNIPNNNETYNPADMKRIVDVLIT